jgi:hypothetical protein
MPVGMSVEMPTKGSGGFPCEAIPAGGDREPARWRTDRAEFLGEDGAGREYWLLGGRIYAADDGRTYPVCMLAGWSRLRKVRATLGLSLGS